MATAEDFSQFDISTEVHTGPHLHVYFLILLGKLYLLICLLILATGKG